MSQFVLGPGGYLEQPVATSEPRAHIAVANVVERDRLYPAKTNAGLEVIVGTAPPFVIYRCDGANWLVSETDLGVPASGVPQGGLAGQLLGKASDADNDVAWQDAVTPVASVFGRTGAIVMSTADVTSSLGFSPYDESNPAGYVTEPAAAAAAPVQSVFGRTGAVALTSADVTGALTFAPLKNTTDTLTGNLTVTGNVTTTTQATADNSTKTATTAFVKAQSYLTSAPVTSVFGRTGAVVLASADVTGSLGYTPVNKAGDSGISGPLVSSDQYKSTRSNGGPNAAFVVASAAAAYGWLDTAAAANTGAWDFVANSGALALRLTNDANTAATPVMTATRIGMTVSAINFGGNVGTPGYFESTSADTRVMMRSTAALKSCTINFGAPFADTAGSMTIQRRALTGDTYESVLLALDLTSGNLRATGSVSANGVLLTSARALKDIDGPLDGAAAFRRVMAWRPQVYSLKAEAVKRTRAGLVVDEAPPEITDGNGHIDLYAMVTELAAALQFAVRNLALETDR